MTGVSFTGAGESNTDSFQGTGAGAVNYACRMRAAVQDWRSAFDAPELPFFNVERESGPLLLYFIHC